LYSHRSTFLHALMTLQADIFGLSACDVVLPIVPMFHANAWGLAFAAPAVGAQLVLPGPKLDGASIFELIESEAVTFSAAVPTVWQTLLAHLRAEHVRPTHLRRVIVGGSACPESLLRAYREDYGVEMVHLWGMTELSPVGTLGALPAALHHLGQEAQLPLRLKQGRPPLGVDMMLTNDHGARVAHDGKTCGHLKVRGPAVASAYLGDVSESALDEKGWFDTGDIATIDEFGLMQITDRTKDIIKSGGEWISSIEIENIAMGHPDVACAAVVAMPDPNWGERPLLLIQPVAGKNLDPTQVLALLRGRIPKWWMPDATRIVAAIPLGATGKIDKKRIRETLLPTTTT
jgi:fatty-acyl-CoA synthase